MPGKGYGKDHNGKCYFYWYPVASEVQIRGNVNGDLIVNDFSYTGSNPASIFTVCSYKTSVSPFFQTCFIFPSKPVAPVTGYYSREFFCSIGSVSSSASSVFRTSGDPVYSYSYFLSPSIRFVPGQAYTFSCYLRYKITSAPTSVTNLFVDNSRVNTTINNYAYETNNNYTYINNTPLFDENTLVFVNPITGVSVNIQDWWYDYVTRTYNLTYVDQDNVTVTPTITYGDETIIVQIGNDTYTYYYTVPSSSCTHDYIVTGTLDATCTATGSKTFTCSKCNDVYTEVLPALGHTWVEGETVETEYAEDGTTVVIQGYTLFTCSRCGEEYFDYDKTGPPESTTESVDTLNWLQRIYYKLCEILNAILGLDLDTAPSVDVDVKMDVTTNTDLVITVPGEDGQNEEFSLKDFKNKFGFVRDIYTIVETFMSDVTGDSAQAYSLSSTDAGISTYDSSVDVGSAVDAPSITIDFGAANSVYGYNYGGEMEILDLSWYTQYKPTVDSIISGFLWIMFAWGVFKAAPGILSGSAMVSNKLDDIDAGKRGGRNK